MERELGHEHYWTTFVANDVEGFAGVVLHRERFGETVVAARVVFWDAAGQFFLQTFAGDVPVEIVEELILEAKERVSTH